MAEETKGWTCAKCKAVNDQDFTRCKICGEPRPGGTEPKKCAHCGQECTGYFDCPRCGSRDFLNL